MPLPDDIRPASFRGVPFEAKEVGRSVGRRIITHEYPQQDEPYNEDQGRAVRRWRLQAFIVGAGPSANSLLNRPSAHPLNATDLQGAKNDLIDACESEGPGRLVHPTDGEIQARCELCEVVESASTRNVVEFILTFVESGAIIRPVTKKASLLAQIAATMKSAINLVYAARRTARDMNDKIRKVLSGDIFSAMDGALGLSGQFTGVDLSGFRGAVTAIRDSRTTLLEDTEELTTQWQDAVAELSDAKDMRTLGTHLLTGVEASQAATSATGLSIAEQAAADDSADMQLMFMVSALAAAGQYTAIETFTAYDDAISARDDVVDLVNAVEPYSDDPDLLAALRDLRASLVEAIDQESIDLPRLRTLEVPTVKTALELAYDLYGDATRALEIIDRNNIADPNAVSGTLQVLTE